MVSNKKAKQIAKHNAGLLDELDVMRRMLSNAKGSSVRELGEQASFIFGNTSSPGTMLQNLRDRFKTASELPSTVEDLLDKIGTSQKEYSKLRDRYWKARIAHYFEHLEGFRTVERDMLSFYLERLIEAAKEGGYNSLADGIRAAGKDPDRLIGAAENDTHTAQSGYKSAYIEGLKTALGRGVSDDLESEPLL